ncbi:MAG: hypothetical protein IKE37_08745 [Firmicutes bacterium]|nr:hypothetical protein [Bacillota bacterium]
MSVEIVDNGIQIAVVAFCLFAAVRRAAASRSQSSMLLGCFFGLLFLAQAYWIVYIVIMGETPTVFYVSEVSWTAAFLFMAMLTFGMLTDEERAHRPAAGYVFMAVCAALTVFFCSYGDIITNIMMDSPLMFSGYLGIKGVSFNRGPEGDPRRKSFFLGIALYSALEFLLWAASCFWSDYAWTNPYYWIDFAISAIYLFIFYAFIRVEKGSAAGPAPADLTEEVPR